MFITEDTFNGYYNDPLSLNKYTYCHNSPTYYKDPDGTKAIRDDPQTDRKNGVDKNGYIPSEKGYSGNKPTSYPYTPPQTGQSSAVSSSQNSTTNSGGSSSYSGSPSNYLTGGGGYYSSNLSAKSKAQKDIENAQAKLSATTKGFETNEQNAEITNPAGNEKSLQDIKKDGLNTFSNAIIDTISAANGIAKVLDNMVPGLTGAFNAVAPILSGIKVVRNLFDEDYTVEQRFQASAIDAMGEMAKYTAGVAAVGTVVAAFATGIILSNPITLLLAVGAVGLGMLFTSVAIDDFTDDMKSQMGLKSRDWRWFS